MSRRRRPTGASLYDFRDTDVMFRLAEEGDDEGWVETELLAAALGFNGDHARHVGSRLSWMRRYGMVERDDQRGLWRLSPGGQRVVEARLRAASRRELEALPEEALVQAMSSVVQRYRFVDTMTASLLRREFLFGTQPR